MKRYLTHVAIFWCGMVALNSMFLGSNAEQHRWGWLMANLVGVAFATWCLVDDIRRVVERAEPYIRIGRRMAERWNRD